MFKMKAQTGQLIKKYFYAWYFTIWDSILMIMVFCAGNLYEAGSLCYRRTGIYISAEVSVYD
jgi:hypothetical protein